MDDAKVFVNVSNHPSDNWSKEQLKAARQYGDSILDIPFPEIDPNCTDQEMDALVNETFAEIMKIDADWVMVQGEYVFTYRLVQKLQGQNKHVVASQTKRFVREETNAEGHTQTVREFRFAGFREYLSSE